VCSSHLIYIYIYIYIYCVTLPYSENTGTVKRLQRRVLGEANLQLNKSVLCSLVALQFIHVFLCRSHRRHVCG